MTQFEKWLSAASNPHKGLDGRWVDATGVPFVDGYDYFAADKFEVSTPSVSPNGLPRSASDSRPQGLDAVIECGLGIASGSHWMAYLRGCERRRQITRAEVERAREVLEQMSSDVRIERAELLRQVGVPVYSGPVPGGS